MTGTQFMTNVVNTWGDWDDDERAQFQKNRLMKFVSENYTETELDELWKETERRCEYRPRVSALNKLMPGRSRGACRQNRGPILSLRYGEVEFSTKAARVFAKQLLPLFDIKIAGDITREEFLNDEDKAILRERAAAFFSILNKLMAQPRVTRE